MFEDTFQIDEREAIHRTSTLDAGRRSIPLLLILSFLLFSGFHATELRGQDREYDYTLGIGPPENLGDGPNTEWAELLPRLNADGTRLYFIRKHAPGNTGGVDDQDDIYYSDLRSDGTWGKGVNIGPPLNTPGSDALFWISPDEKTALLYHGRKVDGKERGLSIARKRGSVWSEPEKISIEGVEDLGNWYYASISPDQKTLLLAYRTTLDEFNLDIFYAPALSDDLMSWGKPVPVNGVNTPFIESSPWLSPDGRSLYFVSDRQGGPGLGDIYVTRRVADDWRYWSKPENIGSSVNTPAFEADVSISADGKWLYSGRADLSEPFSHGRSDLYRFSLPDTLGSMTTITVGGQIVDAATGRGIQGEVQFVLQRQNLDLGKVQSGPSGQFTILVMPGVMYKVVGSAPGYQTGGVIFDARRIDPTDPTKHIRVSLQKSSGSQTPEVLASTRILFPSGSDRIDGSARKELRDFVRLWKGDGGNRTLSLYGFTDSVGTSENNFSLARRRAESVASELKRLGIPENRIAVVPRGEAESAGSEADEGSRRLNRRVDIVVE